jgi:F-type H+-transporting ATPase subunit epsilon
MAETFQLDIVTPDRLLVREAASEVTIPGRSGYLGVLPGHAPLLTELGVGEISYRTGSGVQHLAVAWGFAEVLPNKVTILAETAERPSEIDVARAQQAKERAQQRLQHPAPDVDFRQAREALDRAQTRLDVAQKK